jgi:hypothetical protein
METINEEDNMPFVPMVEHTAIDAYLDDWISRDQLLDILLREPQRLSEKDGKMLMDDNTTLEKIIHQHDVARRLRAQS